jgi:hypothetical protein
MRPRLVKGSGLMDRERLIAFSLVFAVFSRQRTMTLSRAGK